MRSSWGWLRWLVLATVLGSAVGGCTSRQRVAIRPLQPPSEKVWGEIRSVVVTPGYDEDARVIVQPVGKAGAVGLGALGGAAAPIYVGGTMSASTAGTDMGLFTALGILAAPIGAAVGAVAGPSMAMPDAEIEGYRAKIEEAFAGIDPAPAIARGFAERARSSARLPASVGPGKGGTTVELTVLGFGLRGDEGFDPPLQTFVVLRGRLMGADGRVAHELLWGAGGRTHVFKEWAALGREAVRRDFDRIAAELGRQAEEELLELVVVP